MRAVDLLRLTGFHQRVCLRLFLLVLGAAINLGTLAQVAAGTRVVPYPPHLHSEARGKRRFHFPSRVLRTAPTSKGGAVPNRNF